MTLAVLWQDGQRAVGLGAKLIRREDWAELLASHQALERAQRCEREAATRADAAEGAARQRGFEAGRAEGREQGLRETLALLRQEQDFVTTLHEQLVQLLSQTLSDLIAQVPTEPLLRAQIGRCLEGARRERGSRLLVSAPQLGAARQLVAQWLGLKAGDAPDWLEVLAGPDLHGADVVLESHGAIVDGRIAATVQAWRAQVAALLQPPPAGQAHAR